ncbi:MAG: EAL domain-containing protein, partial [Acidimicrobiaceae bacterium]|nr:EAL domain-containing protein [Acidimicrobiaceae bacterium]
RPVWSTFREGSASSASWRREANLAGFHGCIALPIERDEKPWGVISICLGQLDLGGFDKDLLETISDLTGSIALGFARMDSRLRELELSEVQKVLLKTTFAGIGLVNDRHLVWANDRFTQIFGYENPNDLIGARRAPLVDELDQELIDRAYGKLASTGSAYIANLRMRKQDGDEIICDVAFGRIQRYDRVHSVVWTVQDVTDRRRLENQLQYQAEHDFLTGIPNRRSMEVQLRGAIERSKRAGSVCVLGVLDLDDFKLINDRLGHSAGDRLLTQFATRIKDHLRSPDFFARLGGDEFVLILEDYDDLTVLRHLKRTFSRLHKLVEDPFSLDSGIEVFQDMSMGVALYPRDADNPDDLLRVADAALYGIKLDKINRPDWWGFGTKIGQDQEISISESDAYSKLSRTILKTTKAFLSDVNQRFAVEFSELLSQDRQASSVISTLPDDGSRHLSEQISSHLNFLFDPETNLESQQERSWQVGQIHGLVGVEGTLLTHAVTSFRRILTEQINRGLLSPRQKHHLRAIAEVRMQDDLESQLRAIDSLKESYSKVVTSRLPDTRLRWADLTKREMDSLSQLPGVVLVLLLRLDNQKTFTIEKSSGILSARAEESISNFGIEKAGRTPIDGSPSPAQWRGPSIRAWEQSAIFSSGRFASDPESSGWHEMAKEFGIRSILSIPLLDSIGRPVAGLVLFGKLPNQFESHWMKQFAIGVGNRFSELWKSRSTGAGEVVISPGVANSYREGLFGGGFSTFVQPIVDLTTGEVVSVEALARLRLPDGRIVPPGDFLPLLGELEMEQLFQLALDHSLAHLVEWDKVGLRLNISVNLSPTTLVNPDCANTIRSSLEKWSIQPSRLIIELLESERLDRQARDASIAKLTAIGIELAMDDLGEGYSGLRRMSEVPFTTIKIDRSLMANLVQRPIQTMVVIDTLNTMSSSLGRKVVLEGLETEAHLEMAVLLGIPFGQGYGIAMPMPAEDIPSWIDSFVLEPSSSLIRTYLGGLAHHWKFGHTGPVDLCPLSLLFNIKNGVPVEIQLLHARIHSRDTTVGSSAELSDWLQREIQKGI